MIKIVLGIVISFVLGIIAGPILIPFLRKLKFGQEILEIGPNWHKNKKGTPTMGGMLFIFSILVAMAIVRADLRGYIVLAFSFLCGVIGFTDDFIKVYLKRNQGFNVIEKTIFFLEGVFIRKAAFSNCPL